jgi:hypothetical protein
VPWSTLVTVAAVVCVSLNFIFNSLSFGVTFFCSHLCWRTDVREDRRTGLISHVESPVCSRWVARISANQEELKVEEMNEEGIKVKSMNNKERHD